MNVPTRVKRAGERLLPAAKREQLAQERRNARAEAAERKRQERIARRRRALLDSDPAVRGFDLDGHRLFGRVVDHFTATGTSVRHLRLVSEVLEQAEIPYFLVPGRSHIRYVVGVHHENKKRFLDAVREQYRETALYAARPGAQGTITDPALYADGALPDGLKASNIIRFGEYLLGPAEQVLTDLRFGCDVEFWRNGAKALEGASAASRPVELRVQAPNEVIEDALVAPRRNRVADVLPTSEQKPVTRSVHGRDHPTFRPFALPRVDEVRFPIDAVYTWVDGSDPELGAKRDSYRPDPGGAQIGARETGASRYTSHDELKYSLRSLQMYAGFVRHVYIVTDGQVPPWLDPEAEGITVVDHRDIFADQSALPVFNSHAIETRLHHIADLSDHYLYFNDDVFVGRPIEPQRFFHGNGVARLPFSPFQFGLGEPHSLEPAPNSAGKNVRRLLQESHGRFITHKFMHTPHPQRRDVMYELEERFAEDVERTGRSRFRATSDIAMAASLHHHYALLSGRAVPGEFRLRYVDIGSPEAEDRLAELQRSRDFDFFCLNDVDTPEADRVQVAERLHAFLESYFPFPSSFERG